MGNRPSRKVAQQKGLEDNPRLTQPIATPQLIKACLGGDYKYVKEQTGDVNVRDKNEATPLIAACKQGHCELMRDLLGKKADVNAQEGNGLSSLMIASRDNRTDMLELLFTYGADVNLQDKTGSTALMAASTYGNNKAIKMLIGKGARVNLTNLEGESALFHACSGGYSDCVQTLVNNGAEISIVPKTQETLIAMAERTGNTDICTILQARQSNHKRALDFSRSSAYSGDTPLVTSQESPEIKSPEHAEYSTLIIAVATKESPETEHMPDKSQALIIASQEGKTDTIMLLLKDEPDLDLQDALGNTALIAASTQGHTNIARILLEEGAKINLVNTQNETALHQACLGGHSECVQLLLDNKADTTLQNKNLETALDISEREGNTEIAILLQRQEIHTSQSRTSQSTLFHHKLITADIIAKLVDLDPKELDKPCDEDMLRKIAWLLPDWKKYAQYFKLEEQDVEITLKTESLSHGTESRLLLNTWNKKNKEGKYRALVEASCSLGYNHVAKSICEQLKESSGKSSTNLTKSASPAPFEAISDDLIFYPEKIIGIGAFGTIFRGKFNNQPCALKVLRALADEVQLSLPISEQTEPSALRRFKEECERLESIKHPNIVTHLATRQYSRNNNHLILVLELMNCNLRQFFRSKDGPGKNINEKTQYKLCQDIASGLRYLHFQKIVHRDLCSDNILLDLKQPLPLAKICDFGMSKLFSEDYQSISLIIMGRRGFMPPEASSMKLTQHHPSFDIFSFGVIMIQIIRRVPTIKSVKDRGLELDKIKMDHPLKELIRKCLYTNHTDRPSVVDIMKQLRKYK